VSRDVNPTWMTVVEVAKLLDVVPRTVRDWERSGQIPKAYRKGQRWVRWKRAELDDRIRKMKAGWHSLA
jgi:excisionase family DNA binding protein